MPVGSHIIDFSAPMQILGEFKIAMLVDLYGAATIHILIVMC